jgi:hypothetical protein
MDVCLEPLPEADNGILSRPVQMIAKIPKRYAKGHNPFISSHGIILFKGIQLMKFRGFDLLFKHHSP